MDSVMKGITIFRIGRISFRGCRQGMWPNRPKNRNWCMLPNGRKKRKWCVLYNGPKDRNWCMLPTGSKDKIQNLLFGKIGPFCAVWYVLKMGRIIMLYILKMGRIITLYVLKMGWQVCGTFKDWTGCSSNGYFPMTLAQISPIFLVKLSKTYFLVY